VADKPLIKLTIDGNEIEVAAGTTVLKAAEQLKKDIPHFCYHDGLPIVGQCRMCYVEIEGAPKLATSCSTTVTEGMKVLTDSPKVKQGQNATLEFVLLDHPLDCPICDRGGECKLQDYTYEYGPPRSRMIDEKEELLKHKHVSEEIVLDQERCILCTRCVRFSDHVDGRTELVVNERGSHSVINVFEERPMQSRFQGNVVDLCPVGALTAQDYRFKARPWELRKHTGLCTGCSVGCNIELHTKHRHPGIPRPDGLAPKPHIDRLVPTENTLVNDWWMCDKGRWGYHFHNDDQNRLTEPKIRRAPQTELERVSLKEVQLILEDASARNTSPWEFWISDESSHEEISWAKDMLKSWAERGRSVNPHINPHPFAQKLLATLANKNTENFLNETTRFGSIKTVVSTFESYRDLEDIVPLVALKLGQKVRHEGVTWAQRSLESFASSSDEVSSTLYLVPVPKSEADLKQIEKLSKDAQILILWTRNNSRGLINEGIAPLEALEEVLKSSQAGGPIMFFAQTTQNGHNLSMKTFVEKAPYFVLIDSFKSEFLDKAHVVLPVEPLYESHCSFTNIYGMKQTAAGIQIQHPNYESLQKGNPSPVHSSLRLI
jgi:NADH dehydrogenase/NADH:ubiquinone oxidoreductase subunit G